MTTQQPTNYLANIMDTDGESTTEVDIRTLSGDALDALRNEAGQHGDYDLVRAIDSIRPR